MRIGMAELGPAGDRLQPAAHRHCSVCRTPRVTRAPIIDADNAVRIQNVAAPKATSHHCQNLRNNVAGVRLARIVSIVRR